MTYQHKPGTGKLFFNKGGGGKRPTVGGAFCCPQCQHTTQFSGWDAGEFVNLRERKTQENTPAQTGSTQQALPTERHTGYNEWARDDYTVVGKDK